MAKRKISKKEELAYPVLEEITGGAKNGYETKSGDWYQMYSTYSGAFGYRRVWARLIKPYQLNYRDFAKFLQAMPEYKEVFEKNRHYPKLNVLCEPQLGKRGLYPSISTKESGKIIRNMINFISYCDGTNSILDISEICKISFNESFSYYLKMKENGLID